MIHIRYIRVTRNMLSHSFFMEGVKKLTPGIEKVKLGPLNLGEIMLKAPTPMLPGVIVMLCNQKMY